MQRKKISKIRVDEDGALANSSEFDKFLALNSIQIETMPGYSSKLSKIIEHPNREYYVKTQIAIGLQALLLKRICEIH